MFLVHVAGPEPKRNVVADVEPWEKCCLLECKTAIGTGLRNFFAIDKYAARSGFGKSCDLPQERCLSAAGWTDKAHETAGGNVEVDSIQGGDGIAFVTDKCLYKIINVDCAFYVFDIFCYHFKVPFCQFKILSRNLKSRVSMSMQ